VGTDGLVVTQLGHNTKTNLADDPSVTLVWPPADPEDYSLIVAGDGELRDDVLSVTPTRAVLHRPGESQHTTSGTCRSDCVELALPSHDPAQVGVD
jgi:hypothetical protein